MKERIKSLRKALNKSQSDFGSSLNVSLSAVQKWESGENVPSAQTVALICREYRVNEEWLLNGNGEMFYQMSKEEQILDYVGKCVKDKDANVQRYILDFMSGLPVELWDAVEAYGKKLLAENKNED